MIRLSTSHAKARLSPTVTEVDAMAAEEILRFALFKEVLKPERRKKRKLNSGRAHVGSDESGEESEEAEEETGPTRMTGTESDAILAAQKAKRIEDDDEDMMDADAPATQSQTQTQDDSQNPDESNAGVSPQRFVAVPYTWEVDMIPNLNSLRFQ